jgi:hypothetical protein
MWVSPRFGRGREKDNITLELNKKKGFTLIELSLA